jgi:hypothetical protein
MQMYGAMPYFGNSMLQYGMANGAAAEPGTGDMSAYPQHAAAAALDAAAAAATPAVEEALPDSNAVRKPLFLM